MQRVLRINLLSRNQALKKARRDALKASKKEQHEYTQQKIMTQRMKLDLVRDEKIARREDWTMSSLAPNRDAGLKQNAYGTIDQNLVQNPQIPTLYRKRGPKAEGWAIEGGEGLEGEGKEWEGTGNVGNLLVGDRVVVIKGRSSEIGKIGTIKEIQEGSGMVVVEDVNMVDVAIPDWMTKSANMPKGTKHQTTEQPMPIESVRLVIRVTDEEKGFDQDVIANVLYGGAPYSEREYGTNTPRHTRYIVNGDGQGKNIKIPWPASEISELGREEIDTPRQLVESVTYLPGVIHPPIPEGSFDELRSKKSRERGQHSEEYVKRKIMEDIRAQWWAERKLIADPKRELGEILRARAQQNTPKEITPETKSLLEEVLLQSRSAKQKQKPGYTTGKQSIATNIV